jgi:lambda family phage portal protein
VKLDGQPFPDGQALWDEWGKTTAVDYDGVLNWFGLQALVARTIVLSGECLILRIRASGRDGLPISAPWKLRILEPDHLDESIFQHEGRWVEKGIELDEQGRRVAYWVYPVHPGSTMRTSLSSVRIPASEIRHLYSIERPGQLRGPPWLHAAIATIQDLDELEDARVMQAKVAALFGAFVEDVTGEGVGAVGPVTDGTNSSGGAEKLESMEPGGVYYLQPGESIKAADPPKFDAAEQGFANHFLRKIAAAVGVTYEDLTGDYSQVTFSSARMGRLAFEASVDTWQWHMMIPGLCEHVFSWVMETAAVLEGWPGVPTATWTPPDLPPVDPGKDADTKITRIRGGLDHLDEVLLKEGKDPDEHVAAYERRMKDLEARGIIIDSDAGKVTRGGQAQVVTE